MRNLSFRGYAQSKGFDPLQVPDETWKMQDETERTLRGMREVRSQNLQNRNEQLDTLRNNSRKEEQQRNVNQGLKEEFSKAYFDAEMQHYRQRYLDQNVKIREAEANYQRYKKLEELAPKAVMAFAQFQNQRFQNVLAKGDQLKHTLREQLGDEEWEAVKAQLRGSGRTLKNILRERFPDYKRTVEGSLNAWELMAVQQTELRNHVKNTFTPYMSEFKEVSGLNQMKMSEKTFTNPDEYIAGLDIGKAQYIQDNFYTKLPNGRLKPIFSPQFTREVEQIIDEKMALEKSDARNIANKNYDKKIFEARRAESIEAITESPQDVVDMYGALGNREAAISEDFYYWEKDAASDNGKDIFFWQKVFDTEVVIAGETTTMADKYPRRVQAVYDAANARWATGYKQHQEAVKTKINQSRVRIATGYDGQPKHPSIYKREIDILLNAEDVKITMQDIEGSAEGQKLIAGMNRPLEAYDDEVWDYWGKQVADSKGVISIQELSDDSIPDRQKQRLFYSKTVEGLQLNGKEIEAIIDKGLTQSLKALTSATGQSTELSNIQIPRMLPEGKKDVYEKFFAWAPNNLDYDEQGRIKPNQNVEAKFNTFFTEYQNNMSSDSGLYEITDLGINGKFKHLQDIIDKNHLERVYTQVRDGAWKLLDKDFLTEKQDKTILDFVKNGGPIPDIVFGIHRQTGGVLDPIEIINMRLKANGQKEIDYKGAQNLHKYVHPDFKKAMNNFPSKAKSYWTLRSTAKKEFVEDQVMKHVVEGLAMDKEIASKYDEYKAVRTPIGIKEIDLANTTVDDIFNQFQSGQITTISGFNISVEDIRRGIADGSLTGNTLFTEATLVNIAKDKIHNGTAKLYADGKDDGIPGNGQANILPRNYKSRKRKLISKEQRKKQTQDFDKAATDFVVAAQTLPDEALKSIPLTGQFIIEKLRTLGIANVEGTSVRKNKSKYRNANLTPTKDQTTEARDLLIKGEIARLGLNENDLTPEMKQLIYSKWGYE